MLIGTQEPWVLVFKMTTIDTVRTIFDNFDHLELFNKFGNYKGRTPDLESSSADTWYDTVTPNQCAMNEVVEATFVCIKHAYRVHHFDNDDFGAVLLG